MDSADEDVRATAGREASATFIGLSDHAVTVLELAAIAHGLRKGGMQY